jgi:hypothetical protein
MLGTLLAALCVAAPALGAFTPLAGGGSGSLHLIANDVATVDLQGKIVAWGSVSAGRIEVRGKPGAFTVRLEGAVQRPNRRGIVRLENVTGNFYVQGTPGVKMRLDGGGIQMSVAGKGTALPLGSGTYSLNGAEYVAWTGQLITIAPGQRVRKPPGRDQPPSAGTPTTTTREN